MMIARTAIEAVSMPVNAHAVAIRAAFSMFSANSATVNEAMSAVETPCIKICMLDPLSRLCSGCGRSLSEIERWTEMSDAERTQVMAELPLRVRTLRGGRANAIG